MFYSHFLNGRLTRKLNISLSVKLSRDKLTDALIENLSILLDSYYV